MTVKGRTLTQRQHRVGGKLDPDVHGVVFYPTAPLPKLPEPEYKWVTLSGRVGKSTQTLNLEYIGILPNVGRDITIEQTTNGGKPRIVTLNDRQARFVRDAANAWFPLDGSEPTETRRAELPGRHGATERFLVVEWLAAMLMVALHGWYSDIVVLAEHQIPFLRDTLNEWFPD